MIEHVTEFVLLLFMTITALALARLRDLYAVVMLSGIFTLTAAVFYVALDAVDVAFTEAAVGAGVVTVLMLETLVLTNASEKVHSRRNALPMLMVTVTGALLVYGTFDMPLYGDPTAPIHTHVAPRYIQESGTEIGIPNIVTSVLASYRGYDTLGESVVIFAAAIGVVAIIGRMLRGAPRASRPMQAISATRNGGMDGNDQSASPILRVIAKLLIPPIILFALYVQFHGDFGPGGGFQAGVIFAAGFVLYTLIFGVGAGRRAIPAWATHVLLALGVLIYAGTGVAGMFFGGNYLSYSGLAAEATAGQHLGILLVELGVGITVAAAVITIFMVFAAQYARLSGKED